MHLVEKVVWPMPDRGFRLCASSKPLEEDDEEYVVEKITAVDEKRKVDVPEPIDEDLYEDVKEPCTSTYSLNYN